MSDHIKVSGALDGGVIVVVLSMLVLSMVVAVVVNMKIVRKVHSQQQTFVSDMVVERGVTFQNALK